jgi:glycosyltransferase involved in cell wall biosynthesis
MRISVVVNTYNEEGNIDRCLKSVKGFADEIVVVDMHSTDRTVEIAKKHRAKIFKHEYTRFVEPARNFALSKASGDWVLLLDADEELRESLAKELKEVVQRGEVDYVEIPRQNIIFGKWIKNSRWWPDYLPRFFKRGKVSIPDKIHSPYTKEGSGFKLPAEGKYALVHYHYQSIKQYLERLSRYTDIQAEEIAGQGYVFEWKDLVLKPTNEFLSRFFAGQGYQDGLHGLALASLQAFSELILYLKLWEKSGFREEEIVRELPAVSLKAIGDYLYWLEKSSSGIVKKLRLKLKAKI